MRNVSTGSWTIRREYDSGEARKSVINRGSRFDSASLAILKRIDDLESFIQTTVVSAPSVPVPDVFPPISPFAPREDLEALLGKR